MIIEDTFTVPVPVQEAWEFFLDIPAVSTCVPGVEKMEQVDENSYKGTLVMKVGPISAKFSGDATITELEPPRRLVATASGKDQRTASHVGATFTANLEESKGGETEVAYEIDVTIRGRLGQFGQGVIRETAKQVSNAFVECIQARLTGPAIEEEKTEEKTTAATTSAPTASPPTSASTTQPTTPPYQPPSLLSVIAKSIVSSTVSGARSLFSKIRNFVASRT